MVDDLENKIINLDEKRREREKERLLEEKKKIPSKLQLVPFYGVYRVYKDSKDGRATVIDQSVWREIGYAMYQSIFFSGLIGGSMIWYELSKYQ